MIDTNVVTEISKIIGEHTTGGNITEMLKELNYFDNDSLHTNNRLSTKWRRLKDSSVHEMKKQNSNQPFFKIIEFIMSPVKFVNSSFDYSEEIHKVSTYLKFSGYLLDSDGKIKTVEKADTLDQARQRQTDLIQKLKSYNTHKEIFAYTTTELLAENYYHAIFEASKSLYDRIRKMNMSSQDGVVLIDKTFNFKNPSIIIQGNYLKTQQEKNEYNSLKNCLLFIHYTYRNPKAHLPKIYNANSESDALVALSLISNVHFLLDQCQVTSFID